MKSKQWVLDAPGKRVQRVDGCWLLSLNGYGVRAGSGCSRVAGTVWGRVLAALAELGRFGGRVSVRGGGRVIDPLGWTMWGLSFAFPRTIFGALLAKGVATTYALLHSSCGEGSHVTPNNAKA